MAQCWVGSNPWKMYVYRIPTLIDLSHVLFPKGILGTLSFSQNYFIVSFIVYFYCLVSLQIPDWTLLEIIRGLCPGLFLARTLLSSSPKTMKGRLLRPTWACPLNLTEGNGRCRKRQQTEDKTCIVLGLGKLDTQLETHQPPPPPVSLLYIMTKRGGEVVLRVGDVTL
jgi:hypothetical protein